MLESDAQVTHQTNTKSFQFVFDNSFVAEGFEDVKYDKEKITGTGD